MDNRILVNVGLFFLMIGFIAWNSWNHIAIKKINRNVLLRMWVWSVTASGMKQYKIVKVSRGYIAI